LQSDDREAQREALVTCLDESEKMLSMLETLMDISEAETGTMHLERAVVDVAEVARDVVDLYEEAAEDKHVELSSSIAPGLTVEADRARLRQVLANLVDNAVKYTPSGGRVTVTAERDGAEVRIDVADTGIGIAPHDLPRIWERLYRGDSSRAERGLGLGLSLVRAVVLAHGGTISVSAEPGSGSTFTVRLPAARSGGSSGGPSGVPSHPGRV
jgi:signal transduction histidine kinase